MIRIDQNWTSPNPITTQQRMFTYSTTSDDSYIVSLQLLPGGRWLLTLTGSGVVRLWDLDTESAKGTTHVVAKFSNRDTRMSWMNVDARRMPVECTIVLQCNPGYCPSFELYRFRCLTLVLIYVGHRTHREFGVWQIDFESEPVQSTQLAAFKTNCHLIAPKIRDNLLAFWHTVNGNMTASIAIVDWRLSQRKAYVATAIQNLETPRHEVRSNFIVAHPVTSHAFVSAFREK